VNLLRNRDRLIDLVAGCWENETTDGVAAVGDWYFVDAGRRSHLCMARGCLVDSGWGWG
jgi:hypothetical protein